MDSTKEKPLDHYVNISMQGLEELMLQVSFLKKENENLKSEIKRLQWSLHEQD